VRKKRGGMTCVPCDFAHDVRLPDDTPRSCGEEFRSASYEGIIPKQMLHAGWRCRKTTHGLQWMCPEHAKRMGRLKTTAILMRRPFDPNQPTDTEAHRDI
jgi:hypothetical protein